MVNALLQHTTSSLVCCDPNALVYHHIEKILGKRVYNQNLMKPEIPEQSNLTNQDLVNKSKISFFKKVDKIK